MDVLEIFLGDEEEVKQEATPAPEQHQHSADLDLLMEEFRSAPDSATQRDALAALLQLMKK